MQTSLAASPVSYLIQIISKSLSVSEHFRVNSNMMWANHEPLMSVLYQCLSFFPFLLGYTLYPGNESESHDWARSNIEILKQRISWHPEVVLWQTRTFQGKIDSVINDFHIPLTFHLMLLKLNILGTLDFRCFFFCVLLSFCPKPRIS